MMVRSGLICLVAITLVTVASGAVVGIDFGSEFIKVSLVRPGSPFHIVVDEQSKRKIPVVVAFDATQRSFGNGALGLTVKKADRSYMFMQRLLGKSIDSPEVKELQNRGFPWKFVEIPGRGGAVGIQHDEETIYSPEELVAMNLEHIKSICEEDAGGPVKDAVITVPSFWTQNEREALLNAAELAGFHVLSLINQNTAAAVQYGIDWKYNETDPPHNLVIYNMGASSTEVSLVTYTSYQTKQKKKNTTVGQFEVQGVASDSSLGGAFFDERIVEFLLKEWQKQHPKSADITKELRPMAKLRKAAGSAKKVLSANKDTPIFIQSLFNDVDFKAFITREKFYELCSDLIDRAVLPLEQLLADRGVTIQDIDATVIIGGGVRIPIVQQKLKDLMGKDLAQNLNGDESMALGAVFRAANLSTAFQVRKLGMSDVTRYPVGIRLTDLPVEGEVEEATTDKLEEASTTTEDSESASEPEATEKKFSKRAQLFKRYNRVAKRKTVAFTHTKDFLCTMHHDSPKLLPAEISAPISLYNVTGMVEVMGEEKIQHLLAEQKPRVAISFSLSSSGIVNLLKAEATLEEMIKVAVPKAKIVNATVNATDSNSTESESDATTEKSEDGAKDEEGAKDTEEEEKDQEGAEKDEKEVPTEEGSEGTQGEGAQDEGAEGAEAEKVEEVEYKLQKKTHRYPLKISVGFPESITQPLNKALMKNATKMLKALKSLDDMQIKIAATKNKLEGAIYDTRGQLEDEAIELVSTEEQRETVKEALRAAEDWLYDQVDDGFEKFQTKLSDIQALSDPVFFRAKEMVERPNAVNQTVTLANYTREMVEGFEKDRPWIPIEDRDSLLAMVNETEEWLMNKTVEQEALGLHETPAYTSTELIEKLRPIAKFSSQLLRRVKPKEEKKKKAKKAKRNATSVNGTIENATETDVETEVESETTSEEVPPTESPNEAEGTEKQEGAETEKDEL